jgi:hypothetical protein
MLPAYALHPCEASCSCMHAPGAVLHGRQFYCLLPCSLVHTALGLTGAAAAFFPPHPPAIACRRQTSWTRLLRRLLRKWRRYLLRSQPTLQPCAPRDAVCMCVLKRRLKCGQRCHFVQHACRLRLVVATRSGCSCCVIHGKRLTRGAGGRHSWFAPACDSLCPALAAAGYAAWMLQAALGGADSNAQLEPVVHPAAGVASSV